MKCGCERRLRSDWLHPAGILGFPSPASLNRKRTLAVIIEFPQGRIFIGNPHKDLRQFDLEHHFLCISWTFRI